MAPRKTEPRPYHHGDLRAALLRAATGELAENGVERFTLRGCARRAGVSHAAPAHHFGDVTGLLTEVALDAFGGLAASIARTAQGTRHGAGGAAEGIVAELTKSAPEVADDRTLVVALRTGTAYPRSGSTGPDGPDTHGGQS